MSNSLGHHAIGHCNDECNCALCKQSRKPVKIITFPLPEFQQGANFVQETSHPDSNGINHSQSGSKIVSFSARVQLAGQKRAAKQKQARFQYPMLECD